MPKGDSQLNEVSLGLGFVVMVSVVNINDGFSGRVREIFGGKFGG